MRALLTLLLLVLTFTGCQLAKSAVTTPAALKPSASAAPKPNFETDVKPILQARCQPCHFQGGKVYDKLPFDQPATITKLGTRLFTRIKDEKEQRVIREFLAP
jgi:hypothetical protein